MERVGWGRGWMFGTHLQGPHQSVCWLRPKRARHFLGEPGSEHNAQHAQNKKEEKQKRKKTERSGGGGKKGVRGGETKKDRKKETRELIRAGETTDRAVCSEKAIRSNC